MHVIQLAHRRRASITEPDRSLELSLGVVVERDPLRLAWKTSPFRHIVGLSLLALAGLLILVGFDLVRVVVDRATGAAGGWDAPAAFLRIAITPPGDLWPEPVVLFPGVLLGPEAFALTSVAGILLIPVLLGLILVALEWLVIGIGLRMLTKTQSTALDVILKYPPPPMTRSPW